MRNLQIANKLLVQPPYHAPTLFCAADHSGLLAIDRTEDVQGVFGRVIRILPNQKDSVQEVYSFTPEELELLHPLDKAVQTVYVPVTDSLFLATLNGGFYQLLLGSGILEELFIAPSGISAFAVSPDSRLLAVATKEETVSLFSLPDIELLQNIELSPQRPEGAKDDAYKVTIQWRPDSHYFAVNCFDGERRKINFYDETGKFYASTEDAIKVISHSLIWQPSGGLIGTLAVTPSQKLTITFLELNGLFRSSFEPFADRVAEEEREEVLDILWNSSSDVLALRKRTSVELWIRSNYAWMCKKTILPPRSNHKESGNTLEVTFAAWDLELPYRFHLIGIDKCYVVYDFTLTFSKGNSSGSGLAASLNGPSFYATPFRDTCAPPPNCMFQQTVSRNIQEIMVPNFWDGLVTVLTNGELVFFRHSGNSLHKIASCVYKKDDINLQACYSWVWPSKTQLACINNGDILVFEISNNQFLDAECPKEIASVHMNLHSSLSVRAKAIMPLFGGNNAETKYLLIQKRCGTLLLQELCVMPNIMLGRLPNSVHYFQYLLICDEVTENTLLIFGLDPLTKQLYWFHEGKSGKLISDCSSIETFENFFLATTHQGSLEIIEKKDILQLHKNNQNTGEQFSAKYSRKIEKGAIILSCCRNRIFEPSLQLQIIPRGNLETISPRPLMISSMDVLLKQQKFNEVMLAMRRHRLDFNVLASQLKILANHDNPENVVEALKEILQLFLEDVKDSHTLVLMITDLNESHADCVQLIKTILEDKLKENTNEASTKKFIHPYLAVIAKLGLYEEALLSPLISVAEASREDAKSRIKFLGFYCENPETLYEAALGTYNLSLTSLVADCLNKDPKEYIPILNEYKNLPSIKLKFTIDQKLRRYNKAVRSLLEIPESSLDEIIKYVERYKVHQVVIHYLIQKQNETSEVILNVKTLLEEIYCSYGKVFEDANKFTEAGVCFCRGNNLGKAIVCYAKSGNWVTALGFIKDLPDEKQRGDALRTLASCLEDLKNFEAAGEVLEYHLGDGHDAMKAYIKARRWEKAAGVAKKVNEQELIEELKVAGNTLLEICYGMQTEVRKYLLRLRVVKELKALQPLDGEDCGNFSDTESVSTTTSVRSSMSTSTARTYRTGKNSRKMQRKIYSLKEGSRFEDIAIIAHLWETCQRATMEIKPDVENFVPAAWIHGLDHLALQLSGAFDNLLQQVCECVQEVWPSVLPPNEFLEMKYFVAPAGITTNWNKCLVLNEATHTI